MRHSVGELAGSFSTHRKTLRKGQIINSWENVDQIGLDGQMQDVTHILMGFWWRVGGWRCH